MKKIIFVISIISLSLTSCGKSDEKFKHNEVVGSLENQQMTKENVSGVWIFSGESCMSGAPMNLDASGKYSSEGEAGTWDLSGNDIVIKVTETFDTDVAQNANDIIVLKILKFEEDNLFLRTPGGDYMAYRCPETSGSNNIEEQKTTEAGMNSELEWSTVQNSPNAVKNLVKMLEGDSISRIRIALVNLDINDQKPWDSVFVYNANSSACGSAGCSLDIYQYSDKGPANILSVKAGIGLDDMGVRLGEKHNNGMRNIVLNDGPTWIWNGAAYSPM